MGDPGLRLQNRGESALRFRAGGGEKRWVGHGRPLLPSETSVGSSVRASEKNRGVVRVEEGVGVLTVKGIGPRWLEDGELRGELVFYFWQNWRAAGHGRRSRGA